MHQKNRMPFPTRPRLEPAAILALTEDGQGLSNREGSDSDGIAEEDEDDYSIVPRSEKTQEIERHLEDVRRFLETPQRPEGMSDKVFATLYKYAAQFFI